MKDNDKILQNVIIVFCITTLVLIMLAVIFDLTNITKCIPFTHDYDWLGFLGAIVGGLIGAIGTYIGIYFTIRNEREQNRKKEIEDKKRAGYSYVTFTNTPITIDISLDSMSTGLIDSNENRNYLIGENVILDGARFFYIEYNFQNLNSNYPTAVKVENLHISFDSEVKDNKKIFYKYIDLYEYKNDYNAVTIKNKDVVAFSSKAFINTDQLKEIKNYFVNSKFIDLIATIEFINANGVLTKGKFSANLTKSNETKTGNKNCIGSNTINLAYNAENTYVIIENIEYLEDYNKKIFGKNGG